MTPSQISSFVSDRRRPMKRVRPNRYVRDIGGDVRKLEPDGLMNP